MRGRSLSVTLIGTLIAFVFSYIILYAIPYSVPNKLAFATIVSILASSLFLFTFFDINVGLKIKVSICAILLITYALALITVALINFFSSYPTILMRNINLVNIFVSFIPTILVTCFLPGYVILKTSSINNSLNSIEQIVYAILLSILITAFVGFASWTMGSIYKYAIVLLVITNIFILSAFLISLRKFRYFSTSPILNFSVINLLTVILIFSFLYIEYFTIHNVCSPLPLLGDEFYHVGYIVKFLNNYYSWQEMALNSLTTSGYPYFFHLFEAVGIVVSNLPVTYFYILSSLILLPLPLMAFISLANHLTNGNKTLTVFSAVVFQIFSGFGWISAIINYSKANEIASIYSAAVDTNDIIFSTWLPTITAPYLIDLTVFLFALNLALKKNMDSKKVVLMLTPLLLLGVLSHFEKVLLFSALGLILTLVQVLFQINQFRVKETGIAILLSSSIALVLDKVAPKSFFTSFSFLMPSIALFLVGIAITCLSVLKVKPKKQIQTLKLIIKNNVKTVTLFLLLILVFIWILEIYIQAKALPRGEVIPLYYMPLKFGIAGLFALIWMLSLPEENLSKNAALVLLIFTIFSMELLLYHGPFPLYTILGTYVEEFRFVRDITWPVIAMAGAGGIYITIAKIRPNSITLKQRSFNLLLCALLIGIVVSSSTLSHLLKIQYMSSATSVKEKDYSIVQFMENVKVPRGSSIFAPASLSSVLYSVTGAPVYTIQTPFYGEIILNSEDASNILFILKYLNVSYVITSRSDSTRALMQTLQYFPKIYSDDQYDVYKVSDYLPVGISAKTMLLASNGNPVETILNFGFEGNIQWAYDFRNISGWLPDFGTFLNVINYTVTQDNGAFRLMVKGIKSSKIVAFYKFLLTNPIFLEDDTYVVVKFRTNGDTRLLVHILYDDGTMSNTLYNSSVYMNSEKWALSITKIEKAGRCVSGFRIGVSNPFNLSRDEISAEIDFLGIFKPSTSSRFNDALASLSLAKINYSIVYQLDAFNINNYKNIVVIDEGTYTDNTLNMLLQVAEKGHTVLILGNFSKKGLLSNFVNFTEAEQLVPASSIKIVDDKEYYIPKVYIPQIQLPGCKVLAFYKTETGYVPLIVKLNKTKGVSLFYMNIWPLLDILKNSSSTIIFSNMQRLLNLLFSKIIGYVSTEDMQRTFYLKNIGPIVINGSMNATLRELFFPKEIMTKLNVSTSNGLSLNIDGSIELNPYKFGYDLLVIYGDISMLSNNSIIFREKVNGLKILAKVSILEGYGDIKFSSMTSAAPYKVILKNVPYEYRGYFSIEIIPLTNNLLFIYPRNLSRFLN